MNTYVLGVDIGTQGVKCSLFEAQGNHLASSFIPSDLIKPAPGIVEEDPEFQVESVCTAIKNCIAQAGNIDLNRIACIAIDGQMAGIIGIGEDGRAVTPYDSWLDTRCAPYIEQMREQAELEITKKTGNPPSFNHGPKILWWKHEHPETYDKIVSFVQPGGYAAMRLCGLTASESYIDNTYLHFSGFADTVTGVWDRDLVSKFDVDADKLPRIISPDTIIGEMSGEMVKKCGLAKPIPVAAGCGDTAASFLSCGAVKPGICVDVAGTASVFAATTDAFCADTESKVLGCGASVTPGLWHPYAYINGGGMNLEWFVTDVLKRGKTDTDRFSDLIPEALSPSLTDPMFVPHMGGRVSPSQPALRGTFTGLNWSHTEKEMFMAIIESVGLEYGLYRKALYAMLPSTELTEMRITGGGAKSRIWKEIKSAVLQVPVTGIARDYGAPMGSALLAACSAGLYSSVAEGAETWVPVSDSVMAGTDHMAHYAKRLRSYERLLHTMNGYYEEIGINA